MILIILGISAVFAAVAARLLPRYDAVFAWMLGALLAFYAGTANQGRDYDNYMLMINYVRSLNGSSFSELLEIAKDPFFIFLINITQWISDDGQFVLLTAVIISVACKVQATTVIPRFRTLFIALYTVFLAPGLEFSAIRAALGIGFILLALSTFGKLRNYWIALGIAAHLSMMGVVLSELSRTNAFERIGSVFKRIVILMLIFLFVVSLYFFDRFSFFSILGFNRFYDYQDNRGTLKALAPPIATIVCWVYARNSMLQISDHRFFLSKNAIACTSLYVFASLLMALPYVTISHRLLEISWVLFLAQLMAYGGIRGGRLGIFKIRVAFFALIGLFVLSNLLSGIWAEMLAYH